MSWFGGLVVVCHSATVAIIYSIHTEHIYYILYITSIYGVQDNEY